VVLWFAGMSLVLVWTAFRSPALDYRLVVVGALAPDLEFVTGRVLVLHTLAAAVFSLLLVMVATQRRRLLRRRWLGLPIGLFVHLVLDGVWTSSALFWWPLRGWGFGTDRAPELTRPFAVTVLMELAGAVALWWWWHRWSLADRRRRHLFLTDGHVGRDLAAGSTVRSGGDDRSRTGQWPTVGTHLRPAAPMAQ
jgi:hypothetical protein